MKTIGRFILLLVLLTAFADLVPAVQDVFEPHSEISASFNTETVSIDTVTLADAHGASDHHHDGPCVGGHCHLGHCAVLEILTPVVRTTDLIADYETKDSQIPSSPVLDTMKRPPRA